jgi:hypothetical protein
LHIEEQGGEGGGHGCKSPPESEKKPEPKPDVVINMPIPEFHSVGVVLMHVPHVRPLCFYLAQSCPIFASQAAEYALGRKRTFVDTNFWTLH